MLPDVDEDLARDAVGGAFVAEHAVGEAVHEGGEPVVELTEGGGFPAGEALLHLAVPARRYVPFSPCGPLTPLLVSRARALSSLSPVFPRM
ncbi:hypothetical protein GCM10010309_49970 [Streptomyces violaceochromogenes]|nr:hypothetical protein GCM10010309_49970 [Streptomyces violaceochromogenes]